METRLRKTFAYPTEDDDSDEDLDEQQQEQLITNLRKQDKSHTQFYKRAFLPLPLVASFLYLPSILLPGNRRDFFTAILGVTSLLSTAWILHFFPPTLQNRYGTRDRKGKMPVYAVQYQAEGPIEEYLPWLNGAVGMFLAVSAWFDGRVESAWRNVLPAAIFAVIMVVRRQMRPVDVEGLERMRYQYKGA